LKLPRQIIKISIQVQIQCSYHLSESKLVISMVNIKAGTNRGVESLKKQNFKNPIAKLTLLIEKGLTSKLGLII